MEDKFGKEFYVIEEEHKRIALLVFEWFRKLSMYKPMKMRKRRKRAWKNQKYLN